MKINKTMWDKLDYLYNSIKDLAQISCRHKVMNPLEKYICNKLENNVDWAHESEN